MKHLCEWIIGLWLAAAVPALGAPGPLRGLGIDETLDTGPILAPAIDRAKVGAADLPLFVRLLVRRGDLGEASTDFTRLDERVDLYAGRHIPVVLTLVDVPTEVAGIDAWRTTLRSLAEHGRGKIIAYQVGDRLEGAARPAPQAYAYLVKFVAVQVRSIDAAALVVEGSLGPPGAAAWQEQLYREDVAAYVDGVAVSEADNDQPGTDAALAALDGLVTREDPTAFMGVTGLVLPGDSRRAADRLIGWHLTRLGGRSAFTTCVVDADVLSTALKAAMTVREILAGEIVMLDEHASALQLSVNGQNLTASIPHRLLYNMTTFATYLVFWDPDRSGQRLDVSLHLASAGTTVVRDGAAGTMAKVGEAGRRDEAAKTSTARVELSERPLLLDFNFGAEEVYAMRSETAERALPTVEEIVARYQQAETAQGALVKNYIANARVDIHFQPTTLDSYDVVVENRFFSGPDTSEWEETSFSLNGTRFGRNRPPFPLLQPEKVLSLPLTLRFNRDYVYHLEGTDRVGDRPCYLLRFDPIDQARSLYRGKVWIDSERYVRLKVQAVQTHLVAPVVSSEEVQLYELAGRVDDRPVYLFSKLISHQLMLVAGRNLLVDRNVTFSDFHVNDETFASQLQQARLSDAIMYRDTDKGLQHLIKRGDERVVSDHLTTSAKALALGATFDPSYDYPVPLFGIDYVNFNFLNRGLQLGFIFSGVLGGGNIQKANIGGTKFDVSIDFFGIAVNSNDQVFDEHSELKGERLQSRKALTGANLGYQVSDFQKITLGAHAQSDAFTSSPTNTTPAFVVPVNTMTLNPSVAYEFRRGGYSLLAGYAYFRRANWVTWGDGTGFDPSTRSYTKYNVGLSKDFYFGTFNKIHVNAAYYGGERQDRFSMYRFGLFDETRMRGVPSAGVRFSEVGIIRAAYSFNVLNLYRLALYVDHAEGRTPSQRTWAPTTGIGTEVNFPGPKMTMLKLGVGKGFLPKMYRGSGSLVVELMVFKPI